MKRFVTILLAFSALTSFAQGSVDDFFAKVGDSQVSFSYTFSVNAQTKIQGSGALTVQDNAFKMSGNGLEVWCDGTSRWTVDASGKEAVIESVEENEATRYSANPALLLSNLDKAFVRTKSATEKFIKRFSVTEDLVSEKKLDMKNLPIEELDIYWDKAKSIISKMEEQKND